MNSAENQDWLIEILNEVSDEVDGWESWRKTPDLIAASAAKAARSASGDQEDADHQRTRHRSHVASSGGQLSR